MCRSMQCNNVVTHFIKAGLKSWQSSKLPHSYILTHNLFGCCLVPNFLSGWCLPRRHEQVQH